MMSRHPDILFMTEYIENVLYFATVRPGKVLKNTTDTHYFCIDNELVYENYYSDFGPLNLGCVYKYCKILNDKLKSCLNRQILVHYSTIEPKKKANAAFLIGCFGVLYMSLTPKDAMRPLLYYGQSYRPFQDATQGDSMYTVTVLDCLLAIKKARELGFFNFQDFNYEEYDRLDKIQGGDLNWIVPGKFLAFIGPVDYSVSLHHPPEMYLEYFKENNVNIVIRLNKKVYDGSVFSKAGIVHYDLFFPDGSCPPRHILLKFLQISEEATGAIAVHCKAGLGRTGSLIGSYLIKHYRMTAHEAICWMRICRPGSVIGHQQGWLEHLESWLIKQGNIYRNRMYHDTEKFPRHEYGVYSISEKLIKQRPVALTANQRPVSPIAFHRQTRSDYIPLPRPSKERDVHSKATEKEYDWRLKPTKISPVAKTKINSKGSLHKTIIELDQSKSPPRSSSSAGAGEPRSATMKSRIRPILESRKMAPSKDSVSRHLRGINTGLHKMPEKVVDTSQCKYLRQVQEPDYFPLPTFQTSQGPAIKNLNDAKNYLLRRSAYSQQKDKKMLNSSITVTPHFFVTPIKPQFGNQVHTSPSPNKAASVAPPKRRLGLGRSPSPSPHHSPARFVDQTRATNTPSHGLQSLQPKTFTMDSKSTFQEALFRLKSIPVTRDGSIGAASVGAGSLGAQREAPNAKRAPSVRSDERPLATQGDMLNSIKFQRRFSEAINSGKGSELLNMSMQPSKPKPMMASRGFSTTNNARDKHDVRGMARPFQGPGNVRTLHASRPTSPKGRQRPAFY